MWPLVVDQLLALAAYAWLFGWIAVGGRPGGGRGSGLRARLPSAGAARGPELAWLASVGIAFLYPLLVLLWPSRLLAPPVALSFRGEEIVQLAGFGLVLVGGALAGLSFRALGRFLTVEIRLASDQAIVQGGPYARVRHPIYTAILLVSVGIALTFLSLPLWVLVGVLCLLAVRRAKAEEALFLRSPTLGAEYAAYVRRTGRFLPRPGPRGG